jgi:hypothetical protein
MKGELIAFRFTDYTVNCAACDETETVEASQNTKAAAAREFRAMGWATRKGRWYCPACKGKRGGKR